MFKKLIIITEGQTKYSCWYLILFAHLIYISNLRWGAFQFLNFRDVVDTSRIHRGKKNKGGDAKKLLDNKDDLLRSAVQKLK